MAQTTIDDDWARIFKLFAYPAAIVVRCVYISSQNALVISHTIVRDNATLIFKKDPYH